MENIHERVLHLRDVALGQNKSVQVNSDLAPASYDCAVDSLLALYNECHQATSLAKDKHVGRFLTKYEEAVKALKELRLTVNDFEVKGIIGRGHFGEVQVVTEKSTGDVFAMKVMRKAHILQQADSAFFNEERDIMAWTTSPWLTSLHYAFQDSSSLYLVMDFHPGGDLLTIMERREGGMSEDETRFYLSEIVAGLDDLHRLGFVHRDVKPENVLITRTGHIKLVDFGSAARLGGDGKVMESRLPVGTPEYIAPEVLMSLDKSADYGVCCDWWSLGIIAYELLYESTPFEDDSTSKTYGNIMNYKESLSFPDDVIASDGVKDLIAKLLTDPISRLTCDSIKNHNFFQSTDWGDLLSTVPPHVPVVSSADDMSNFDNFAPEKDDLRFTDLQSKNQYSFSGTSLPFVGFTFTRFDRSFVDSVKEETDQEAVDLEVVSGLKSSLEKVEKELQTTKEQKASLERECVIYQSQLDDFHRKLEIEKTERRQSDTKALQLLEEVREQGRIAKQLRESEATVTESELNAVIQQLEQDRAVASKRARRMKEELKQAQTERDTAIKAVVELKSKLTLVKETSRKEIAALQAKVAQVTESLLSKSAEMQDRLTEAHERHQEVVKNLQASEEAKRKMKYELQQLQMQLSDSSSSGVKSEALVQELEGKLQSLQKESESSMNQCNQFRGKLKEVESQLDEINSIRELLQDSEVNLKKELQEVKMELGQLRESREQLMADKESLQNELATKNELVKTHEETSGKLMATKQFLETKVAELEKMREASDQQIDDNYKAQLEKVAELEREKQQLKDRASSLEAQLILKKRAVKEVEGRIEQVEEKHKEKVDRLRGEIRSLQSKLSEVSTTAIQQGERLRDVRKAKREIDQENADLKTAMKNMQNKLEESEKRFEASKSDLERLADVTSKLAEMEKSYKALEDSKEKLFEELEQAQNTSRQLVESKKKLELDLHNTKKQFEAQELKAAMSKRSAELMEEELGEVQAIAEEAKAREAKWKSAKDVVAGDLETAEARLDDAYTATEKEKNLRLSAEQRLSELMSSLEKTAVAHSEEVVALQENLLTQKQLASKYNDKMSELEKDLRLKILSLKGTQKELDTERLVSSKVYDEAHSLRQELGKVKAAHMKLVKEVQDREAQLAKSEADRSRVLSEQKSHAEARYIHETRLQATIAQQSKLIDYLQKVGTISPRAGGLDKIKKGLKLGRRKGRDPARDIAEWNKLKGMATSKTGKGVLGQGSFTGASLLNVSQTSSISTGSSIPPEGVVTSTPLPGAVSSFENTGKQKLTARTSVTIADVCKQPLAVPLIMKHSSPELHEQSQESSSVDGATSEISNTSTAQKRDQTQVAPHISTDSSQAQTLSSRKRSADESTEVNEHKFHLKSAGIRKTYMCSICNEQIRPLQKLVKCSACQVTCHPSCSDQILDNCFPISYSDLPPLAKRQRKGNKSPDAAANKPPSRSTSSRRDNSCVNVSPSREYFESSENSDQTLSSAKKRQRHTKSPDCGNKSLNNSKQPKSSKKNQKSTGIRKLDNVCNDNNADSAESMPPLVKRQRKDKESQGAAKMLPKLRSTSKTKKEDELASRKDTETDSPTQMLKDQDDIKSEIIMSEKVTSLWGKMKSEGWLILTDRSLYWYDKDPSQSRTKPVHSCQFGAPKLAFTVLASVDQRSLPYATPTKLLQLSFGIEKCEADSRETIIFIARNSQSKTKWIEAINTVLSSHSHTSTIRAARSTSPNDIVSPSGKAKELKAVTIVPVRTGLQKPAVNVDASLTDTPTPSFRRSQRNISSRSQQDLDLSIHSSMFGSPSDTSFV